MYQLFAANARLFVRIMMFRAKWNELPSSREAFYGAAAAVIFLSALLRDVSLACMVAMALAVAKIATPRTEELIRRYWYRFLVIMFFSSVSREFLFAAGWSQGQGVLEFWTIVAVLYGGLLLISPAPKR